MHRINLQDSNINQKDLNNFKTLTMLFAFSKVGAFFATFISPLLEAIINYGGTVFLIVGIYFLAKKYTEFVSGMKVVFLFVVGIIINLLSALFIYLYPIPAIDTQNPQNNLQAVVDSFYSHAPFLFVVFVVGGVITLITAYYFTEWFNTTFTIYNPTKSYLYYGIAFGIGSIIAGVGTIIFAQSLKGIDLSNISEYSSQILPGLVLFAVGSVTIFVSFFIQILASFKIYNRANDKALGKLPFNIAQQSANQQPIQNSFQKITLTDFSKSNSSNNNKD